MYEKSADITGICINEVEYKIFQFANDTQLMNNGDEISVEKSSQTIKKHGKVSALFFNTNKTEAI